MSTIGKNLPHDSAGGHVSGESIYIDDMLPTRGELLVDFYYSPVSHGRIKSLDLSAAAQVEGVVGLYTYKDLEGENLFGPIVKDEVLLVEKVVEYIGHPIVVIAAESRKAISLAKKAIRCDIEELPPVLTIDAAKAKKQFLGPTRLIKRGDVNAAFAAADHIIEGVWTCNGQDHFYMEGQAAIVYPGEHNQLVVHSSTQNPTEGQDVIAHVLGLKANQVVLITKRMGGGFGGKECQATHPAAMAALVAHKTKRPARIIYNKDDDMRVTGKRHPYQNEYKVGFTKDGRIVALQTHLYSDGGATNDLSLSVMSRSMTHIDNAYYLPNAEIHGSVCKTNYPPNTAFRGFGGPQGIATMENIIEEIAIFLKMDALEVRRINLYGTNDRNITPYGQIFVENNLPRIFDELEASADYWQRRREIDIFNRDSLTHLKGLAFTSVKFGISFNTKFLNQANALVNIYLDGTIQVSTGATEMGQGVNTHIKQLVAAEFEIDADDVIVMATSTEKNNNTSATAASSATDLNGQAAVNACRSLRERLTDVAARRLAALTGDLQASPTSIVFHKGTIYDRRRPQHVLRWKELVDIAYHERVSLGERGFYATPGLDWAVDAGPEKTCSGSPFLYYTQGAAVAEVTIDRFTGDLKIDRVDMLMDIGTPINPGIARGQITGAFIQGMGWVTTEELKYNESGELLSHSPTTYKIPNIQDLPPIFNINTLNIANPVNIKGSKTVGEPPLCLAISVWAAVKNALRYMPNSGNAKLHLPATNEEILKRLTALTATKQPADKSAAAVS